MNSLHIHDRIVHERIVDSVMHSINAGMGTTGMTTGGPCMTMGGPCMTTGGAWKDWRRDRWAAMGLGLSTKQKAEIRAQALKRDEAYERQHEKEMEEIREQRREREESWKAHLARERARDEKLKNSTFVRTQSWEDARAQECLPPWQRKAKLQR